MDAMRRVSTLSVAIVLLATGRAEAYKEELHAKMSRLAFNRANLETQFLPRLGLSGLTTINGQPLTGIVAEGAIEEDTLPFPPARPMNHFMDPQNGHGGITFRTTVGICGAYGIPADEWALESQFGNSHNLPKAHDQFYDALTGPSAGARNVAWRELFLSIGHMIHLVQDMAQPEHTRNDQHLEDYWVPSYADDPSLYEGWTATNLAPPAPPPGSSVTASDPFFNGYVSPSLGSYREYFSGPDNVGMADFSSINFVTKDTNYKDGSDYDERDGLQCVEHQEPRLSATTSRLDLSDQSAIDENGVHYVQADVWQTIYERTLTDGTLDPWHTVKSSLDLYTRRYDPNVEVFSLGEESMLMRAVALVPRAVGFSAGFVNRFFRGNVTARWTRVSPLVFNVTITNKTGETIGADAEITATALIPPHLQTGGNDAIYLANEQRIADLVPGYDGLSQGESVTIPNLVIGAMVENESAASVERRIAIRGSLGSDEDAVIGLVQPALTGPVRLEMTWSGPVDVDMYVETAGGRALSNAGFNFTTLPNVIIAPYQRSLGKMTFPTFKGGQQFMLGAILRSQSSCAVSVPVTYTVYRGNTMVYSQTRDVNGCFWSFDQYSVE